jgi:hypothetical protein
VDGALERSAREDTAQPGTLRSAQVAFDAEHPASALARHLGDGPFALVCLFVSPSADFAALTKAAKTAFGGADVIACTTAGELGRDGYEDGQIIALGFPEAHFAAQVHVITDLASVQDQVVIDGVINARLQLASLVAEMASEFAFLLVDGLSMREEHLTTVLASGLGPVPLFGGSAGDGTDFEQTWLSHNGRILQDAAILTMVRSHCPVEVFSLDHLVPTQTRMVVTEADPDHRIVRQINAEPAAREYARLLGKDPHQLSPFIFAAHPVVVRLGDSHHVRAIQRVNENGELVFFSAINEGMVLTLADHQDMARHLDEGLRELARDTAPDHILGCDCILRRIEAGQVQQTREVSRILSDHNVLGFSTYGEQIGALHVNQTLTGVAIFPPEAAED